MNRIIFLNRYFFPDHSATSQLLTDLAEHLAERGTDVVAIASRQRYDDPGASLPQGETINRVRIQRLGTTRFGRSRLAGRSLDYLSFYVAAWRSVLASARPGDILVAKTDPPLLCVAAMHAARHRRLHLVNWIQDLYPEIAIQLGVPLMSGVLGASLYRLRDASLRAAVANVVVGNGMAERVRSRGIEGARVKVIPNWCDDDRIRPTSCGDNPLRRTWGLEGRFVVGYSGNLGRAHEFDTILGAAEHLHDAPNIVFLLIGGGTRYDELRRRVAARSLESSFRFLPYQDRAVLRHSLAVPDIHWISLKPEIEGLVVPSKFYGIAAAGRPIVAISAGDGELADLVRRNDCGLAVQPGEAQLLAAALRRLSTDPERVAAMGRRSRAMLDSHFTRRQALARWCDVLDAIG